VSGGRDNIVDFGPRRPAVAAGSIAERLLPSVHTVRAYRPGWLHHDLFAGLVLTAVLVPAGMGYAEAAGLPAVNGLYATVAALVAYAVVGPSRIVVLEPDSSLTPLIAAAVLPLTGADPSRAAALAAALAIVSGLLCIAAGLARFGFLTDLLSLPVRSACSPGHSHRAEGTKSHPTRNSSLWASPTARPACSSGFR
jgi:MFS superfamily sulfate permease-like transporter